RHTLGSGRRHMLVVVGGAAHHGAQTDHGILLALFGEPARDQRHLEGARRVSHGDVLLADAVALEPVERTLEQAGRDGGVEARDHDRDLETVTDQVAFDHLRHEWHLAAPRSGSPVLYLMRSQGSSRLRAAGLTIARAPSPRQSREVTMANRARF